MPKDTENDSSPQPKWQMRRAAGEGRRALTSGTAGEKGSKPAGERLSGPGASFPGVRAGMGGQGWTRATPQVPRVPEPEPDPLWGTAESPSAPRAPEPSTHADSAST